jgi:hypothetical protein
MCAELFSLSDQAVQQITATIDLDDRTIARNPLRSRRNISERAAFIVDERHSGGLTSEINDGGA